MEGLFSLYQELGQSGLFDPEYYLAANPEIAARNLDPLLHYLEEGAAAGRNPNRDFDSAFYLEQCRLRGERPDNPLLHYLRVGRAGGLQTRAAAPAPGQPQRAAEAPLRAPIRLAIERVGVLAGPAGTSRIAIGGWALAAVPITEITLSLGREFTVAACGGLARPDIAALYPGRDNSGHSGFVLGVDLANRGRRTVQPIFSLRTSDGTVAQRALRIEIPPQELEVAAIDPLAEGEGPADAFEAPMRLAINAAAVDPAGILRIAGWVVSLAQIEQVEVLVNGAPLGPAALGIVRPDIEEAWPHYPNSRFSGFALITEIGRVAPGICHVAVKATARAGVRCEAAIDVTAPRRRADPAGQSPVGVRVHAEEASWNADGRLAVAGWALAPAALQSLSVLLDGKEAGRARLGIPRPDIGNLYPESPQARHSGFELVARVPRTPGEPRVSLVLRCADGAVHRQELSLRVEELPPDGGEVMVGDAERQLHIETPEAIDGALPAPVRGDIEVTGWAVAKAGVAAVEIAIDGVPVAVADYGRRRLDVRDTHPGWPGAEASGFAGLVRQRVLPQGAHTLSVTLRDTSGRTLATELRIEVEPADEASGPAALRRRMSPAEIALGLRTLQRGGTEPAFTVVMPIASEPETLRRARRTIASLQAQAYKRWHLVLAAPVRGEVDAPGTAELAALDPRISVLAQPDWRQLAAMMKARADAAFLSVLTAGEELGVDAFLELALAAADGESDFLYSDERRPDPASGAVEAFFKPGWSPDLLLATNYVGHLWCARGDLVPRIAQGADPLLGHGEYDLILRCTEAATAIRHVPLVLCERPDAVSPSEGAAALGRAMARNGVAGDVRPGLVPGSWRLKRRLERPGLVSIVIPIREASDMAERCVASLRRLTAYDAYEILCMENIPPARVISTPESFRWSRFNNLAAAQAKGEYLLFLDDGVEITDPDWLDAMLEDAQRPEVGVVGPRLLYPEGRVLHAGMFLAAPREARHAFRYAAAADPGYFGLALTRRNVIAVSGICLLTRRQTFEALGGFDETQGIVSNDLDFCLRAWRRGLRNVYTPHASLTHHREISRPAAPENDTVPPSGGKWRDLFFAGDPYFSPHLSKAHDNFTVDREPIRLAVIGHPILPREEIGRILVLKLDHIGDGLIAFPALRRLRRLFPNAHIAVLTPPSTRPIWAWEPSVDRAIEFEFFHPRTELGEHERTEEELEGLRDRLMPERFDMAIDLRTHPETRPLLRYTGARWLAGFDFRNRFPWLDVALDWGGDQIYARKHHHDGDDLIHLVDALAAACEAAPPTIAAPLADSGAAPAIPGSGPLVCVHPCAGNAIKQWPVAYFGALIDRLIEADNARVVLVGVAGEEAVAEDILALVRRKEAVASVVGRLPLSGLPGLLGHCALFVGNDSGPKHLAAALGVPTVGIHGGAVDVREWGPVGPAAIAVSRDVTCAPCYLAYAEECPRGLACLTGLEPARVYDACRRLLPLGRKEPGKPRASAKRVSARRAD